RSSPAVPETAGGPAAGDPKRGRVARVAVLGASGYSGHEFVRLALGHPGLAIAVLVSREHAGRPAAGVLPGTDARVTPLAAPVPPDQLARLLGERAFDTLVACLPHGAWRQMTLDHPSLAEQTPLVIDLSSDFRDGTSGGSGPGYVYGQPEAFRDTLAGATRI